MSTTLSQCNPVAVQEDYFTIPNYSKVLASVERRVGLKRNILPYKIIAESWQMWGTGVLRGNILPYQIIARS
jgi:hypothetical protein